MRKHYDFRNMKKKDTSHRDFRIFGNYIVLQKCACSCWFLYVGRNTFHTWNSDRCRCAKCEQKICEC